MYTVCPIDHHVLLILWFILKTDKINVELCSSKFIVSVQIWKKRLVKDLVKKKVYFFLSKVHYSPALVQKS